MPYRVPTIPALSAAGVQVDGITRSAFLLRGTLALAGLYGAGAVGPFVGRSLAQAEGEDGDVEILNFALTLEYLEAEFYRQALDLELSAEVGALARTLGAHEAAHVSALTESIEALGGAPAEEPRFSFPIKDEASFLELALTLEETGVSAYNGAGPLIVSPEVLAAAGGIVQIEARHAADIRRALGEPQAPEPFDPALEMAEVLDAIEPFVQS